MAGHIAYHADREPFLLACESERETRSLQRLNNLIRGARCSGMFNV